MTKINIINYVFEFKKQKYWFVEHQEAVHQYVDLNNSKGRALITINDAEKEIKAVLKEYYW